MKLNRSLFTAAVPLVLLATLLTGCSSNGGAVNSAIKADASGAECTASGSASNAVTLDGDLGAELTLTSATPAEASEIQRSVLIEGGKEPFAAAESTSMAISIFNGKTGELVNHVANDTLPNDLAQLTGSEWAYEAVRCGSLGQRVALVVPAGDAVGGDPTQSGFDLTTEDTFVIVIDFIEPYTEFGDCDTMTERDEKFPEVDLGDGTTEPVITIPECMTPPADLEVKVLVEGDGAVVQADQNIMTNYLGVKWNGAERFDGNWTATGVQFSTAQGALIDGFTQAMIGQKIGSTILVTMPAEFGYGVGTGHELADTTLTFVLQLVSVTE